MPQIAGIELMGTWDELPDGSLKPTNNQAKRVLDNWGAFVNAILLDSDSSTLETAIDTDKQ